MTLMVDFNRVDKAGRVPALIPAGLADTISVGSTVLASDGEGTECVATVNEVTPNGIAYLVLEKGSVRRSLAS